MSPNSNLSLFWEVSSKSTLKVNNLYQNYLIQSWDELEIKTQTPKSERLIDLTYDKLNKRSINGHCSGRTNNCILSVRYLWSSFQLRVDGQEDNGSFTTSRENVKHWNRWRVDNFSNESAVRVESGTIKFSQR